MKLTLVFVFLATGLTWNMVYGQEAYMAAFSANLNPGPGGIPLHFDVTTVNRGNNLDESTYRVTIPRDGVYIGMLSTSPSPGQMSDMVCFEDSSLAFSCYRVDQPQAGHTTYSRDVLFWFRAQAVLYVQNAYSTFSTPTGLLTSWGTASLPVSVSNVAFTVARLSSFSRGKMTYDAVRFNIGNGWQAGSNCFVAPVAGTYFFSFSVAVEPGVRIDFKLMLNQQERLNIYRMSTSHNRDHASRSALISLSLDDKVEIESYYSGWSNENNITTFSGFLYQPSIQQRYAWGAYRTSPWTPDSFQVSYDLVLVNDGSLWDNDQVNCFISGVYYVYISAGLQANAPVELTIMKNNQPMGSLLRDDITHNGVDTFGRSMLVECTAGEVLWVSAAPGTELYSDLNLQTSFCGFYLNP